MFDTSMILSQVHTSHKEHTPGCNAQLSAVALNAGMSAPLVLVLSWLAYPICQVFFSVAEGNNYKEILASKL